MPSISFDRAASYYNATRAFPPGAAEQIAQSLASRLPAQSHLLEIGVGTGRIALPLMRCGLRLTGVDISINMMAQLKKVHLKDRKGINLVLADATSAPFPSGVFNGVVGVHVLHLIPGWLQALQEARRVLKPGGHILLGGDGHPTDLPFHQLRRQLWAYLGARGVKETRYVSHDFAEVKAALQEMGASSSEWIAAEWEETYTLAELLDLFEKRIWSSTWDVPDDLYAAGIRRLRRWAARKFADLNEPQRMPGRFSWLEFSFP
jgi:ubiquinone/menaquinone biosynthesis C-methylase UbiE